MNLVIWPVLSQGRWMIMTDSWMAERLRSETVRVTHSKTDEEEPGLSKPCGGWGKGLKKVRLKAQTR